MTVFYFVKISCRYTVRILIEYLMMKALNQNRYLLHLTQWLTLVVGLTSLLYSAAVLAEGLKDPTQPPAILNAITSPENEVAAGPVLQSIMIGPQYHAAIINGEKVFLGKKYQAATLIKLTEHEAVLRNPDMSTQTLTMDFAISKKVLAPVADHLTNKQKARHQSKQMTTPIITKPIELSEKK